MRSEDWYSVLVRVVLVGAGLVLLFWFLNAITLIVLFLVLTVIFAMALNPPVTWLEGHRVPRWGAALMVVLGIGLVFGGLLWLIMPRLISQSALLIENMPEYTTSLVNRVGDRLEAYPEIQERLNLNAQTVESLLPSVTSLLTRIGRYTLSAVTLIFVGIILLSAILYMLIRPRPLLAGYLGVFPESLREKAANAFARASQMIVGWMWANALVGAIQGVVAGIFLTWLGIPGALVWALLTFVSELVPKLGPYLMTIPPALVALATDPMNAVWVVLFYIALNEITSDTIYPWVGGAAMDLHPVSLIFSVLAMAAAFGFWGALIATPVAGIVKAYYEEFYLSRSPDINPDQDLRIERMLTRKMQTQAEEAAST